MARVAVIIPVFNGASTITRAIESALAQHFQGESETIVVNDGSTDATGEILACYSHRIRIIEQENRGPAAARNAGVSSSSAEYLVFLDADDAFMPEKLARTIPVLASNPDASLLFHDAVTVDRTGREVAQSYVTPATAHAPLLEEMLSQWWPIVPTTAVMRRSAFEACGGFDTEFKSAAFEDPYLWIRAREHGEFVFIPEPLAWYTIAEPAARSEKYLQSQELFIRRINERYGAAARGLIRGTRLGYTTALGYSGLLAMRDGNIVEARRYFLRALRDRPGDIKSAMRLLRTFLPKTIARALTGRTARSLSRSEQQENLLNR